MIRSAFTSLVSRPSYLETSNGLLRCGDLGIQGPMLRFLKIFSPKKIAKKLAFLTENKAKF
jgi:hypothetical protein